MALEGLALDRRMGTKKNGKGREKKDDCFCGCGLAV